MAVDQTELSAELSDAYYDLAMTQISHQFQLKHALFLLEQNQTSGTAIAYIKRQLT
jgi:hypothetical protein